MSYRAEQRRRNAQRTEVESIGTTDDESPILRKGKVLYFEESKFMSNLLELGK